MSDIVARLRGPIPVSAFNAAGVVERYDASPSPLDIEAANEIERLLSELSAARADAFEEAAKVAEDVPDPDDDPTRGPDYWFGFAASRDVIAAAIRELKDK